MSDIPKRGFTPKYYDSEYFAGGEGGKAFRGANGKVQRWSYYNPEGEWLGCEPIVKAWKEMFSPVRMLDVGCGRGTFVAYARDVGIQAEGFDFSEWAVKEGRYKRCRPEWLRVHDATRPWPYLDSSFDLVTALDFYEHIYQEDLEFVIGEMYRVAKRWVFLQIATVGGGSGYTTHQEGYVLKKGEPVPVGLEGCAVAGHVTVCSSEWWYDRLDREDWLPRRDMVQWFCSLVDPAVIKNWLANSIIVLERI